MPVEERLLGLVGVGDVERLPRMRQPHARTCTASSPARRSTAVNSPKSTSASAAGGWVCGTITCRRSAPISTFSRATRCPHARLAHPCAFLLDQPLPDPARGLPLLPRRRQIRDQPAPDRLHIPAQHRRRPRRRLPRRRDRISQRLPHRRDDAPGAGPPAPGPTNPHHDDHVGYVRTAPLSISPSNPAASRESPWQTTRKHEDW